MDQPSSDSGPLESLITPLMSPDSSPEDRPVCPACGSRIVPVVYGMPGPGMFEDAEAGNIILGGCVIDDPRRFGGETSGNKTFEREAMCTGEPPHSLWIYSDGTIEVEETPESEQ